MRPVENWHNVIWRTVWDEEFRVFGFRSTVATDINVETFLRSNESEVLILRFGTFPNTTRHPTFDFVRSTNT